MKIIAFIGGWVYILIPQLVFTAVFNLVNSVKWILRGGVSHWWRVRRTILANIKSRPSRKAAIDYVRALIEQSEYRFRGIFSSETVAGFPKWLHWARRLDRWPTWTASVPLILARTKGESVPAYGNCQDCAHLAKWLFRKVNRYHGTGFRRHTHIFMPILFLEKVHYIAEIIWPLGRMVASGEKPLWRVRDESRKEYAQRSLKPRYPRGWVWFR